MRASIIIPVLALVLTTQCFANKEKILLQTISRELARMWLTKDEVIFLRNRCTLILLPKVFFWSVYHDGTFTCPEWTDIEGKSKKRCKIDAVITAMNQFLKKGIANGLFKYMEAVDWLNDMKNATSKFSRV